MNTNWPQFLGRFHPLLVHLPVGFLLFAALLSAVNIRKKNQLLSGAVEIALLAGFCAAIFSCFTGLLLSSGAGYNETDLALHKWMGFAVAFSSFFAWLAATKPFGKKIFLRVSMINWLLCSSILLMTIGAHAGGRLTHGEGYLSRYMPASLKSLLGMSAKPLPATTLLALDSVIVYRDIVQPIINNRCISCHNPHKTNGDLDLSTLEAMIKGGKSGNTLVAGNTEQSELYHRITLPQQSGKFMPADNRPPLTAIETHFIGWWINNGALPNKTISAMGVDEKTKYLVAAYLGIDAADNKTIVLPAANAADAGTIRALNDMKLVLKPLSSGTHLLEASFVMLQQAPPETLREIVQKLATIKDQVYHLDISYCQLSPDMIQLVGSFKKLTVLKLQKTSVTDETITALAGLHELTTLNLGQNNITAKSIPLLKQLPALKKINLWQTQVSKQAAKELPAGVIVEGLE